MRGAGRHRWTAEAGDDYNPVSDLVFTLFAVSILLLAVVGSNGTVRERAMVRLRADNEAMAAALEDRAPPAPAADRGAEAAARNRPDAALAALRREMAELEGELARARQETARVREASALRLDLGTVFPERAAGFLDGATLREGNALDLLIRLVRNRDAIQKEGINRIALEVDVAPRLGTVGKTADGDAEYEESLALARALVRRLRGTAIPFSCVAVLPFGKSRASSLTQMGRGERSGETLSAFETIGEGPVALSKSEAALARAAEADNRITLVGERIPAAPCDTSRLVAGIDAWHAEAIR